MHNQTQCFFFGSVYFAVNDIIAFRSILPQLHNSMSHKYYILFYSTVLTNSIVNPRSHEFEAKQTEVATRIEPKISAALPSIRCALSTELPRSRGNLAQNGA